MIGSLLVGTACAGLAMTVHHRNLGYDALLLMCLMAVGQSLVVSPLCTAVMTAEDDRDAIVGSGVNNAISRSAWLMSVAAIGSIAAFVFGRHIAGTEANTAVVSFGVVPDGVLSPEVDILRRTATDAAYAAIAWVTAGLAVLSALIAAATLEWKRGASAVAR